MPEALSFAESHRQKSAGNLNLLFRALEIVGMAAGTMSVVAVTSNMLIPQSAPSAAISGNPQPGTFGGGGVPSTASVHVLALVPAGKVKQS
jgi:hypothetical protein